MAEIKYQFESVLLPSDVGGFVDIEQVGFGAVKGALVFMDAATDTLNPITVLEHSFGMWDGVSQQCTATFSQDGVGTSNTRRTASDQYVAVVLGTSYSELVASYTMSAIPNGVRITMAGGLTSRKRYALVTLFGGADMRCKVGATPAPITSEIIVVDDVGFAADVVFCTTQCMTAANTNVIAQHAYYGHGFAAVQADSAINQYTNAGVAINGVTVTRTGCTAKIDTCIAEQYYNAPNWASKITEVNSAGFVLESASPITSNGKLIYYLAISIAGVGAYLTGKSAPNVLSSIPLDTGFRTKLLFGFSNFAKDWHPNEPQVGETYGVSIDGSRGSSQSRQDQHDLSVTNVFSLREPNALTSVRLLNTKGILTQNEVEYVTDTMVSLKYTTVEASFRRYSWYLALAGGDTPIVGDRTGVFESAAFSSSIIKGSF